MRYTDPTGHRVDEGCGTEGCNATKAEINYDRQRYNAQNCKSGAGGGCPNYKGALEFATVGLVTAGAAGSAIDVVGGTVAGWFASTAATTATATACADGDCTNEVYLVYRGLAEGKNIANGLSARMPGIGNSPVSHVAGKFQSQWISTTKDINVALERFGKNGVVVIDLSKVTNEIVDLSKGIPGYSGMLSNWAIKAQEVLVKDYIPPEAIKWFFGKLW